MKHEADDLQSSYDQLSGEYADRIAGELTHKPMDRELLTLFLRKWSAFLFVPANRDGFYSPQSCFFRQASMFFA